MTTIHFNHHDKADLIALARESVRHGRSGDVGAGMLFVHLFAGWLIFDTTTDKDGQWFAFQPGLRWETVSASVVCNVLMDSLVPLYQDAASIVHAEIAAKRKVDPKAEVQQLVEEEKRLNAEQDRLKDTKNAKSALMSATGREGMSISGGEWDQDPWLLGVENGVVDMRADAKERFRPGRPEDYITLVAPCEWREDANYAGFETFLGQLFEKNASETVGYLKRMFGSYATGEIREKVFNIFYGENGNNGKTTLMELIGDVLGPYSQAANKALLMKRNEMGASERDDNMFALRGRRMIWISETDKGESFNVGGIKFLTGKDSITCRQSYGKLVTFRPTHHIILSTNNKPKADATDNAFWSRTVPIEFPFAFVTTPLKPHERKVDMGLKDRLLAEESSGILKWLVEGAIEWQSNGLAIPNVLLEERQDYRDEQNWLKRWMEDRIEEGEHYRTSGSEAYQDFAAWQKDEEGFTKAYTNNTFGEELKKLFEQGRNGQGKYYTGFRLKSAGGVPKEDDMQLTTSAFRRAEKKEWDAAIQMAERISDVAVRTVISAAITKLQFANPPQVSMFDTLNSSSYDAKGMPDRLKQRAA